MTTIEKIRAEIERRIKELEEQIGDIFDSKSVLRIDELKRFLSFLDTLEEPEESKKLELIKRSWYRQGYIDGEFKQEPMFLLENHEYKDNPKYGKPLEEPVCEELDEELDRFIASGKSVTVDDYGTYKVSYHDFKKVARHFANWQKEQDTREMIMSDGSYFQKCYDLGKKDMKEQMMNNGTVILTEEDFDAEKEKSVEWGYNLCKEQMMKEAVEGDFMLNPYPIISLDDCKDYDFKDGDKVRIVIVKEEI